MRSISRYSKVAKAAVTFPLRRARRLQRAIINTNSARPRRYKRIPTRIARMPGRKYREFSARLSHSRIK